MNVHEVMSSIKAKCIFALKEGGEVLAILIEQSKSEAIVRSPFIVSNSSRNLLETLSLLTLFLIEVVHIVLFLISSESSSEANMELAFAQVIEIDSIQSIRMVPLIFISVIYDLPHRVVLKVVVQFVILS